jgi:ABC-type phosphate/phosphonate transport system substrate-binding protein
VVFYHVRSNAAEIEGMRSGRLHVGGLSTGPIAFAVNLAGAVPFAVKGCETEFQRYDLIVVVKASSPYQRLSDLKGKRVEHTSPSSNSGHLAPLALFRCDIDVRESAVLGLVGAGGIGMALDAALNLFQWDRVALVLAAIFAIVIAAELIVTQVRKWVI